MNKFYILFFFSIATFSQNLVVIDENNKPVIGASIFSDLDNYLTTDKNGVVGLDKFAVGDTININQYGFEEFKSDLRENFETVIYFKPKSSRKESRETYVIAKNIRYN